MRQAAGGGNPAHLTAVIVAYSPLTLLPGLYPVIRGSLSLLARAERGGEGLRYVGRHIEGYFRASA